MPTLDFQFRFRPVRRFFIFLLDCWFAARARLIERRDLYQQHEHQLAAVREQHRQREAELQSQIALKDREIKTLALMLTTQNARIESLLSACARVTEDAKHVAPSR